MTKRPPGSYLFNSKDRYIDEMLAAQEREESQKEPQKREDKRVPEELMEEAVERMAQQQRTAETLTPRETRRVVSQALLAGLAVGAVFLGGMFLFLLFCVHVWF